MYLQAGKNLKHTQANCLSWGNCPPSPGPSLSQAQQWAREQAMNAYVHIILFSSFPISQPARGLLSPNPLPLSLPNNQTTFFLGFSGCGCGCPHQGHFCPLPEWSRACPLAQGTWASPTAHLPQELSETFCLQWKVFADLDYFGSVTSVLWEMLLSQ